MHNPAADALAAAVAELRKAAQMTQRDLATALGREQNFVARVETGQRRLDLIDWINICRACGVSADTEVPKLIKRIAPLVQAKRGRKP